MTAVFERSRLGDSATRSSLSWSNLRAAVGAHAPTSAPYGWRWATTASSLDVAQRSLNLVFRGRSVNRFRRCGVHSIAIVCLAGSAFAQTPLVFTDIVRPIASLTPPLRSAVQAKAKGYPFVGFAFFGSDSALLVFEDSTLTTP